jgi:hypothetical protein
MTPPMNLLLKLGRPAALLLATGAVAAVATGAYFRLPSPHLPPLPHDIDTGVVVLFAPACALMLALLYEVARRMTHDQLPQQALPLARAIPHWRDADAD